MSKKTILIIVLVLLLAGAGWYFFLRKDEETTLATTENTGLGAADTQCFNALLNTFKSRCDAGWVRDLAKWTTEKLKAGPGSVHPDYLMSDGKLSKSGAFMAVYAAAYHGAEPGEKNDYGYKFDGKTKKDGPAYYEARRSVNDALYAIFQDFQTQYELSRLSAINT